MQGVPSWQKPHRSGTAVCCCWCTGSEEEEVEDWSKGGRRGTEKEFVKSISVTSSGVWSSLREEEYRERLLLSGGDNGELGRLCEGLDGGARLDISRACSMHSQRESVVQRPQPRSRASMHSQWVSGLHLPQPRGIWSSSRGPVS